MTIDQFWNSTPKEYFIQSSAFKFKSEQNFQYIGWAAWNCAYLHRVEKMPPLRKFLENITKKPQGMDEQLKIVEALNIKFKGKDLRNGRS